MNRLVSSGLWSEIKRLAKQARVRRAAIAYVASDEFLRLSAGDLLITDASDHAIASGQTSAAVLADALGKKVHLYSCAGLHAKVLLFDDVAIIGSSNASKSSAYDLIEAAVITDQPSLTAATRIFLEALKRKSDHVDEDFVERIKKIEVVRSGFRRGKSNGRKPPKIQEPQTWLVGVAPFSERRMETENKLAAPGLIKAEKLVTRPTSEANWILWTGNSKFRREAKLGDMFIMAWRKHGNDETPKYVYRHAPILRRQEEAHGTRLYFEWYADAEETRLTWNQFLRLTEQVGVPRRVSADPCMCIPESYSNALFELWNAAKR